MKRIVLAREPIRSLKTRRSLSVYFVVVTFLFQVISVFLLFLYMVMYANEVKTKEKENYLLDKKNNCATDIVKFYTACKFLHVNE